LLVTSGNEEKNMDEKTEHPAEAEAQPAPRKNSLVQLLKNPTLIVGMVSVLVLSAVLVGMWSWKSSAVSAVEERLTAEKTQAVQTAQAETAKAKEESKALLLAAQREKLLLFGKPLAWALRDQVIADNQRQIDDYIGELIRQPGFDRIVLARTDGSIALASDRKMIDGKLESLYPPEVAAALAPTVLDGQGGKLILAVPVMGTAERLAVMALTYDPAAPQQVVPAGAFAPPVPVAPAPPAKPAG
jgi:hypothetical protein